MRKKERYSVKDVEELLKGKEYKDSKAIVDDLPDAVLDEIFEIMHQPSHTRRLRLNMAAYEKERNEFVAAKLLMWNLGEAERGKGNKFSGEQFGRFFAKTKKTANERKFQNNAIKGLDQFPEVKKALLDGLGIEELDPAEMKYIGDSTYEYEDKVRIIYSNSPIDIYIVWLV